MKGEKVMTEIIAHTMQYVGDIIDSSIKMENYTDEYYEAYKEIYEACFHEMRVALGIKPIACCDTREQLYEKQKDIYLLLQDNKMVGSVAIYGNEIDDFIVSPKEQKQGYGKNILHFAIHHLQQKNMNPIVLHVADWNQRAMKLYLNSGFEITKTESIKRGKSSNIDA